MKGVEAHRVGRSVSDQASASCGSVVLIEREMEMVMLLMLVLI